MDSPRLFLSPEELDELVDWCFIPGTKPKNHELERLLDGVAKSGSEPYLVALEQITLWTVYHGSATQKRALLKHLEGLEEFYEPELLHLVCDHNPGVRTEALRLLELGAPLQNLPDVTIRTISIKVPDKFHELVSQAARDQGQTLTTFIRRACADAAARVYR